jgi:hypothetical protein
MWVSTQRRLYKAKSRHDVYTLENSREQRLLGAGFVFETRTNENIRLATFRHAASGWNKFHQEMSDYLKDNGGKDDLPRRWTQENPLANWANRQRREYKKLQAGLSNCLTPERYAKLQAINFDFSGCPKGPKPNGKKEKDVSSSDACLLNGQCTTPVKAAF